MAHTSLYRKYRPATFDDVVGQQHIERTIRNAVAEGAVAHAYLFTGPRGTGKTTTARLLAKALLCERGPTDEPDATCQQCVDIAEGRHPDVYELDAASRTGVENVREEIIGRVSFAPTRGPYKVYIIDEVHMLSTAAFNALLKTLEEPPENVVFVMCTTHPNKVPETIQSRCQRFDFRRLSIEDIADNLRYISEAEGIRADRGVFTLIARHAEGGMRDAITTLEQLAAFTGDDITTDDVEGMLGEVDAAQLFEIAGLVARRDIAGSFRWLASIVETGTDLAELVRELTAHVRDLFVIAAVGDATGVVDRTAEDLSRLEAQAAEFGGPDRLARMLDLLGELASEMRWSSDPRLSLEVALTRMARPQGEMTLEAVAERVEALERGVHTAMPASAPPPAAPGASAPPPAAPGASAPPPAALAGARGVATQGRGDDAPGRASFAGTEPEAAVEADVPGDATAASTPAAATAPAAAGSGEPAPASAAAPVPKAGGLDRGAVKRNWQAVLVEIKKMKPARVQTFTNVEVDVDPDGQTMVVEFPSDQAFSMQLAEDPENRELLKRAIANVFGAVPPFRYQLGRGAVRPVTDVPAAQDSQPSPEQDVAPAEAVESVEAQTTVESAPAEAVSDGASDLERLLVQGMGATIVGEHVHETDGEDV